MLFPKPITYTDKAFLAWMRGRPCQVCGKPGGGHHVRKLRFGAGTGIKPHDYCCIILCGECHRRQHDNPFIEETEYLIIDNLMAYIQYLKGEKQTMKLAELIEELEDNACSLKCVDVPTGGDDYDIQWHVVEYHLTEPKERVIGYGSTPIKALKDAFDKPIKEKS